MSDLLSQDDYEAIARDMTLPVQAFINGKFTAAINGGTMETVNPATGEVIAHIAACDEADVDYAVEKAKECFERGTWAKMHPTERKHVMIKLVKLMKRHKHELAVLEALDSGKPIHECQLTDVPETDDPVLARLYGERAAIQNRIEELRELSGSLDEDVYLARMEDLLVELALKNREIEAAGGGP